MNQPAPNQPAPAPSIWGETNVGKQRNHNEDQVYPDMRHKTSLRPPTPQAVQARGYLLVVADGIGGAQVGDTAANFAIRTVADHYYADPRPLPLDKLLQSAVELANTNVHNYVKNSPAIQQAGCTLTAAAIRGSELVVAHVGDSRAYLLQDGGLHQLTTDHNVAQMMASGQPLPGGGQGLAGNMLVRSLGAGPAVEVEVRRFILKPGDTVLVCSDGLHGVVSDDEIRQILGRETPQKGARKLIDLANAHGGPDNISVVIARVPGGSAAAAAPGGAKPSNRITALAIAVLGLLAVLAVMLFALNQLSGDRDAAMTVATVDVVASVATEEAPTSPAPATPITQETAIAEAGVVAAASPTVGPLTGGTSPPGFNERAPTSTPIPATPTLTLIPASTPVPSRTPAPGRATDTPRPTGLFPAPTLEQPQDNTDQRKTVSFRWSYYRGLRDGEQFRVLVRKADNQPEQEQWFGPTTDQSLEVLFDQYSGFFKDDGTTFRWNVVVINSNSNNQETSYRSDERSFVFRLEASQPTQQPPTIPTTPSPDPPTPTPRG